MTQCCAKSDPLVMARESFENLAQAGVLPKPMAREFYTDPVFHDAEVELLHRNGWHALARICQLPNKGDYLVDDLFGEKVMVVNTGTGGYAAMSPVCRHRWAQIAEGQGNCRAFACPYHHWSYDLEGRFRSAPLVTTEQRAQLKNCRLHQFACRVWNGWIFASIGDSPVDFDTVFGPAEAHLGAWSVDELVIIAEPVASDLEINWKVAADNIGEGYHAIAVHPETLAPALNIRKTASTGDGETFSLVKYFSDVPVREPIFGDYIINYEPEGLTQESWNFHISPTHVFGLTRHFGVWQRLKILGPSLYRQELIMLGRPEWLERPEIVEEIAKVRARIEQIDIEDRGILLDTFRSMHSRHATGGALVDCEGGVATFQTMYLNGLLSGADASAHLYPAQAQVPA